MEKKLHCFHCLQLLAGRKANQAYRKPLGNVVSQRSAVYVN